MDLGQAARDRLLDFFRELAALGRMARAIGDQASEEPLEVDLEPLTAQCETIHSAYDQYLAAKLEIYRAWARYLSRETFVGPEVVKIFTKIDDGLPGESFAVECRVGDGQGAPTIATASSRS